MNATTQPDDPARLPTADRALTDRVLASFDAAPSARLREVMRGLVAHLHAFASDVRLTEEEWATAVSFLTRAGQISDDRRQELILLSDVLGLSMLVVGINHEVSAAATASTVVGPFFVENAPEFADGDDISGGAAGEPCFYSGRILSATGAPIPDARIDVWHSDDDGNYDVQYPELDGAQGRGRLRSGADGGYRFSSVLPVPYPIPHDGPVGELLDAAKRDSMRPAHVHFRVSAPGFATLTTHVFVAGDPYLGSDAVFGETDSLVRTFARHDPGPAPGGRVLDRAFSTMEFDFVLDVARTPDRGAGRSV
ncbi:dioxygenase [Nonomuraea basaltis]|uniref:dioxygenase family protein n=1 Tax=Nonomuraea basaltis TaxID=2495887 RepID=UPI00110C6BB4|nr:dioxygenase [Nonomuraea basaltis]TMR94797.1 hydroxyquinol 1,2-dioxygenase [Nonomuraea basaltis]